MEIDQKNIGYGVEDIKKFRFQQFLNLKIGLEDVIHRKICQKVFLKYLRLELNVDLNPISYIHSLLEVRSLEKLGPFSSLTISYKQGLLRFMQSQIHNKLENTEIINEQIRKTNKILDYFAFYSNLKYLNLNFAMNKLYEKKDNLKSLFKRISKLKYLSCFSLNLRQNFLGGEKENLTALQDGLDNLKQLEQFELNLYGNHIKKENILVLLDCIQKQSFLKKLSLNLGASYFKKEDAEDILEKLGNLLSKKSNTLEKLDLNLSLNWFCECEKGMKILSLALKKLTGLRYISLDFGRNQSSIGLPFAFESLQFLKNLKEVRLNFQDNGLVEHNYCFEIIGSALRELQCLEKVCFDFLNNNFLIDSENDCIMKLEKELEKLKEKKEGFEFSFKY